MDPIDVLEELVLLGDVHITHGYNKDLGGVRIDLDIPNGFAVSKKTVREALIRIGEEYLDRAKEDQSIRRGRS